MFSSSGTESEVSGSKRHENQGSTSYRGHTIDHWRPQTTSSRMSQKIRRCVVPEGVTNPCLYYARCRVVYGTRSCTLRSCSRRSSSSTATDPKQSLLVDGRLETVVPMRCPPRPRLKVQGPGVFGSHLYLRWEEETKSRHRKQDPDSGEGLGDWECVSGGSRQNEARNDLNRTGVLTINTSHLFKPGTEEIPFPSCPYRDGPWPPPLSGIGVDNS